MPLVAFPQLLTEKSATQWVLVCSCQLVICTLNGTPPGGTHFTCTVVESKLQALFRVSGGTKAPAEENVLSPAAFSKGP